MSHSFGIHIITYILFPGKILQLIPVFWLDDRAWTTTCSVRLELSPTGFLFNLHFFIEFGLFISALDWKYKMVCFLLTREYKNLKAYNTWSSNVSQSTATTRSYKIETRQEWCWKTYRDIKKDVASREEVKFLM